jgi:probable phosphoglycerate mutase
MKIIFVRYGHTNLNNPKRMQGISDLGLNDKGIEQANDIRKVIENKNIDIIIVSPLKRAIQTAKIINYNMQKEIIIDKRIIEMNFGNLEGEEYSEDYWNIDFDYKSYNGESISEFQKRIYGFIEDIKNKFKEKNVLIVAHRRSV